MAVLCLLAVGLARAETSAGAPAAQQMLRTGAAKQHKRPLLTVVVTNYYQNELSSRAVKSVVDSARLNGFSGPDELEVIVVHDGADNTRIQMREPYGSHVRELIKEHTGLAGSRNYAIERARGVMIMCLDGDDYVRPDFFRVVGPALRRDEADVLQTDMANRNWGLLWAPPAYDYAKLPRQNQFHASAIFRRSLWVEYGHFRTEFFFGWEDWDFWLRLSGAAAAAGRPLSVVNIREPLFVYTVGSMHGFCVDNHAVCRAIFYVAHMDRFERAEVVAALLLLLDAEQTAPFWKHKQYGLMRRVAGPDSPLANLLRGAELLTAGDFEAAVDHFRRTLLAEREATHDKAAAAATTAGSMGGFGGAAAFLIDQAALPASVSADELARRYDALDGAVARADAGVVGAFPLKIAEDDLFHSFVSTDSGGSEMRAMLHVSLTSLLRSDRGRTASGPARAYVWTNVPMETAHHQHHHRHDESGTGTEGAETAAAGAAGGSDVETLETTRSVVVLPMSPLYFARRFGGAADVAAAAAILRLRRSKYFRTHVTDVLRYSVLLRLGGTYHDLDVVFRPALATSRLRAAIGVENYGDYGEIAFMNGAVMLRFERGNAFLRRCLASVVPAHDPAVYNSIGPALVTSVAKAFIAEGRACVEATDRAGRAVDASCAGTARPLTVVDTTGFYKFHWSDAGKAKALAKGTSVAAAVEGKEEQAGTKDERDVLALHLWNGLWHPVRLALAKPASVVGQLLAENGLADALARLPPLDIDAADDILHAAAPAPEDEEGKRGAEAAEQEERKDEAALGPTAEPARLRRRSLSGASGGASGGTGPSGPPAPTLLCSVDGSENGAPKSAGTVCRAAASVCDVAEVCDGSSRSCPTDGFAPFATVARPSINASCDPAEVCSGTSASVPADSSDCATVASTVIVRFPSIDFNTCCGTGPSKQEFLDACTAANAPLVCVDVVAGSAVVTFAGTVTQLQPINSDPATVTPWVSSDTTWDFTDANRLKADGEACSVSSECINGTCGSDGVCMARTSDSSSNTTVIVLSVVVPIAVLLLAAGALAYYFLVLKREPKTETDIEIPPPLVGGVSPKKHKHRARSASKARTSLTVPAGMRKSPPTSPGWT